VTINIWGSLATSHLGMWPAGANARFESFPWLSESPKKVPILPRKGTYQPLGTSQNLDKETMVVFVQIWALPVNKITENKNFTS